MALRPYEDIVGPLIVPYRGKTYELTPVTLNDGLRLHKALSSEEPIQWGDLIPMLLGDAYQTMVDDHVPPAVIDRALWTALADFQHGRETAESVWENGVPKEVLESLTTIVEEQAKTIQQAAATTTKRPASGSGTKPPKTRANRSRGSASSSTGS